ncbi:MAG: polysaccharide biosynthesis tyrosine autokinase [Pseudomonadota bacterium]
MRDNPQMVVETTHTQLPDDDRVEVGLIFVAVWRRKWMIMLCMFGFAALFFAAVSQVTPQYTARASVMLDPRSVQVLSSDDVVSDLTLNNALLDTEVSVLRSNILLEEVISQLDAAFLEQLDPANTVPSMMDRARSAVRTQMRNASRFILGGADDAAANVATVDPEVQRMRRLVGAIRQSLTVWREGQSYLISVSLETPNPTLSMVVANTVTETYISRQLDDRRSAVRGATRFLEDRVELLRAGVEEAEEAVGDFRINQLAESGLSQSTIDQQLLDLSTQLALARADLSQTQARFAQIQTVIENRGISAAADLLTSPFVISLRQQQSELGRERADLMTRVRADHPDRRRVDAQISLVTEELRAEVQKILATMRNDVEVARSRAESIQLSLSDMEGRSADMSRTNVELRQLEREADAVRENYQTMLNRLNETRSTEQLQRADARMVERAIAPGGPSSPRVTLITAFGGAVGLSIGLIATFTMMMSNVGFKRASQVEKVTGLPVLASLLKVDWSSYPTVLRALRKNPYGGFAERLRQLRTALSLEAQNPDAGACVMVTSSLASEGKTATALSLAQLEVLANRSCVVLDLDLRKSRIAQTFGYQAKTDLVGTLLQNQPLEDAIYTLPEYGFDILTVSESTPQLMDLVTNAQWAALIADLKSRYDLVLIDTAPVMLVSDTHRLVKLVDYILVLVRQNETRQRAVVDSARKLEDMGANAMAAVLSVTDPSTEKQAYGY